MAGVSTLACVFDDLVGALSSVIEKNYIFLNDRPDVNGGDKPMKRFCVINLPVSINDYVIGGEKTMMNTAGIMYLFVKSRKNSSLDPNSTGEFIDSVEKLFPIKGTYVVATSPVVQLKGSDGYGYQVVTISFFLRSRWKVFAPQGNQ